MNTPSKPYRIFGVENIEQGAIDQFFDALNQPFSIKGALMADAHQGYAMPIGGVIVAERTIVPAWVGYDIGCGVLGLETSWDAGEARSFSKYIIEYIRNEVPMGFNHHKEAQEWVIYKTIQKTPFLDQLFNANETGYKQVGTLGGGNHFIEIGKSQRTGKVWIIVHSGSRNIGHKVATHYMKKASPDGKCREDHFGFDMSTKAGSEYLKDVMFCQRFALGNRTRIAEQVRWALDSYCSGSGDIDWNKSINRNHNFVTFSHELKGWIHRKGAIDATDGELGIIPGNMRDGAFIVSGLGCMDALLSGSHGAGRVLSRKKAKQELDFEEFKSDMEGVEVDITKDLLDEAPRAYKSIRQVMEAQEECVQVHDWIQPIINIKA